MQCYNAIFLQQYDIFYKFDNDKEKNLEKSAKHTQEREHEIEKKEKDLPKRLDQIESLMQGNKVEIERLRNSEK